MRQRTEVKGENPMRIIFMGTPYFAIPSLKALLNSDHEVVAVATQPDRPRGRELKVSPPPIKEVSLENKIPIFQPATLKTDEIKLELSSLNPDLIVVVAFGQIIPPWLLELPHYGCINVHASLLPHYRGAAPIQRAIMDGCTKTGVTTMFMDEGLDTGKILLQSEVPISPDDTAGSLQEKLAGAGAKLLLKTIEELDQGRLHPRAQDDGQATSAHKIEKEDEIIRWHFSAEAIRNQIRALTPSPGAHTFFRGKRLKVWRAEKSRELGDFDPANGGAKSPRSGVIISLKQGLIVATGTEPLVLLEVQPEASRKMTGGEFISGYRVKVEEKLG